MLIVTQVLLEALINFLWLCVEAEELLLAHVKQLVEHLLEAGDLFALRLFVLIEE